MNLQSFKSQAPISDNRLNTHNQRGHLKCMYVLNDTLNDTCMHV